MESKQIKNMQDLCDYFSADEPAMLNRRIYKDTACGASISLYLATLGIDPWGREEAHHALHDGMQREEWGNLTMDTPIHSFTIQSIVEGSDATVDSQPFVLPVPTTDIDEWMDYMEREADYLWKEANEFGDGGYDELEPI